MDSTVSRLDSTIYTPYSLFSSRGSLPYQAVKEESRKVFLCLQAEQWTPVDGLQCVCGTACPRSLVHFYTVTRYKSGQVFAVIENPVNSADEI